MPNSQGYVQWVLEQLSGAGRLTSRRMFGGVGLYQDDVFFAIISGDVLYFKVGETNRTDYETRGARQFRPFRDKPHLSMSYYELPADILDDTDECVIWVRRAVAAAVASRSPARKSSPARPARPARAKRSSRP
jgi:DNA transformation protein and related proteins